MTMVRVAASLTAGLTVLTLAACATRQPPPPSRPAVEQPAERPLATAAYMARVASLDLYAIRSGELALQRAGLEGNRAYARRMIEEHHGLATQLSMAGRRLNLLPSSTLQPEHQGWLDQLAATTSPAHFDATYRRQQMAAHESSYRAHAAYAYGGESPTLRMVARSAAGIEQEHGRQMRMM